MRLFLLVSSTLLLRIAHGSYCGENGVPFSLEILPNGAPVLGCAQPSCVAQPAEDVDDTTFQMDAAGQPDGFFRQGDRSGHDFLQTNKLKATCAPEFDHLACTKKNQWIGGIDFIDHPRQPLLLRCCSFEGLRYSQDVGVTVISPGETVTGGEVIRDNRQISFDIIANVRKIVDEDDRGVSYEVTVRRMNCLPDPPEIEVPLDDDVGAEILRVLEKSSGSAPVSPPVTSPEPPKKRTKLNKKNIFKQKKPEISFGAPIFTPDGTKEEHRAPGPRRIIPTTAAPTTQAPQTIPTLPTAPSVPTMPTLPTLAPFAGFGQPFFFGQPQRLPQAFGVSQANLAPLPPPTQMQFPMMFQQSATVAPYNPFALPQPQPFGIAAQPRYGENPAAPPQQYNPFAPMQYTTAPFFHGHHMFGHPHFGLPQQQPLPQHTQPVAQSDTTSVLQQPQRKALPDEKTELNLPSRAEPQIPPINRQLGALFQPPQFSAIDTALQNFRLQG